MKRMRFIDEGVANLVPDNINEGKALLGTYSLSTDKLSEPVTLILYL